MDDVRVVVWSPLEEIRPRQAEEEEDRSLHDALDVREQLEEPRLGPVEVVDEHGSGPILGERLQEQAKRPRRVRRSPRRLGEAYQRGDALPGGAWNERTHFRLSLLRRIGGKDARSVADGLQDRLERSTVAVRKAATPDGAGSTGERREQLLGEPGLAHSRLPDHRRRDAAPVGDDTPELRLERT